MTQKTTHNAVDVRGLRYAYGSDDTLTLASFSLPQGQSCAVIGPSGCGKTTFVHLLAGLLTPSAGSVKVLGQELTLLSESARDRFRGRHIGFVFQQFHLLPALTVYDNLTLAQRLARRNEQAPPVEQLLDRLGIAELAARRPRELSHGQAQRVAIARALAHRPALVIADEPTSALDDKHCDDALALLRELTEASGAALLVVTHDQRVKGQLAQEFALGGNP